MKCEKSFEYQRDFYINAKMKVKKANKSLYIEMKKMQQG
jgi:hypothetical protein